MQRQLLSIERREVVVFATVAGLFGLGILGFWRLQSGRISFTLPGRQTNLWYANRHLYLAEEGTQGSLRLSAAADTGGKFTPIRELAQALPQTLNFQSEGIYYIAPCPAPEHPDMNRGRDESNALIEEEVRGFGPLIDRASLPLSGTLRSFLYWPGSAKPPYGAIRLAPANGSAERELVLSLRCARPVQIVATPRYLYVINARAREQIRRLIPGKPTQIVGEIGHNELLQYSRRDKVTRRVADDLLDVGGRGTGRVLAIGDDVYWLDRASLVETQGKFVAPDAMYLSRFHAASGTVQRLAKLHPEFGLEGQSRLHLTEHQGRIYAIGASPETKTWYDPERGTRPLPLLFSVALDGKDAHLETLRGAPDHAVFLHLASVNGALWTTYSALGEGGVARIQLLPAPQLIPWQGARWTQFAYPIHLSAAGLVYAQPIAQEDIFSLPGTSRGQKWTTKVYRVPLP